MVIKAQASSEFEDKSSNLMEVRHDVYPSSLGTQTEAGSSASLDYTAISCRVDQIKLFLLVLVMLRMELSMLGKHCATKQCPQPLKSVCNLKNRIEVVKYHF